jgi:hypothetical protein
MHYRVSIPQPSAKRLTRGTITVTFHDPYSGDTHLHQDVPYGQKAALIVVPEGLPWKCDVDALDAPYFSVMVEYMNATGSRKETAELKPEPLP